MDSFAFSVELALRKEKQTLRLTRGFALCLFAIWFNSRCERRCEKRGRKIKSEKSKKQGRFLVGSVGLGVGLAKLALLGQLDGLDVLEAALAVAHGVVLLAVNLDDVALSGLARRLGLLDLGLALGDLALILLDVLLDRLDLAL
jgi:hypothetical protein